MKKTITTTAALALIITLGIPLQAQEAPPQPAALESWLCNYKEGQDISDLMGARDYLVRQADRAGLDIGPAYLWSLFKGDIDVDVIWHAPHQNLSAYAAAVDREAAAEEMSGVNARFDAVVDCRPVAGPMWQTHEREDAAPQEGATLIASNACMLKPGVGAAHVADLRGHIGSVMASLGDKAPNASYAVTPVSRGPTTAQLVLFNVFGNMGAYSDYIQAILPSEAGQRLGRHMGLVAECGQALWRSQQVIVPTEE